MSLYPGVNAKSLFSSVDLLQAPNDDRVFGQLTPNRLDQSFGTGNSGHARNIELQCRLADRLFVVVRSFAKRSINDQSDLALADEVGDIWAAFVYLKDGLAFEADLAQPICRAVGCDERESQVTES